MQFNRHLELRDKHAFLSASGYHWINYTPERLLERWATAQAAARGTRLHAIAHDLIKENIKLPATSQTLNSYVNDCIGHQMEVEQVLAYSINAFGTADAINFRDRVLRIFDLKTGVTPASMNQPKVYAGLFCLEYKVRPMEIEFDLRLYQNDEILVDETDPEEIVYIMDRIVEFDQLIESAKENAQ